MISIQVVAIFLLLARIMSDIYIGGVIKRQYQLLKIPIDKSLRRFRWTLFFLSIAIFVGNVIPIVIDSVTAFGIELGRPSALRSVSIFYSLNNAMTSLISAFLIHTLYRLAAQPDDITKFSEKHIDKK